MNANDACPFASTPPVQAGSRPPGTRTGRGTAARTGREEMAEERADLAGMNPTITGGDVDVDVEKNSFDGSLDWTYEGPMIFYSASF